MRNQIWFPSTFDWLPPDIWDAQAKFQTFQSLFLILQKKTVSVLLGCLEAQKPFQGQPWIQVQMHMKLLIFIITRLETSKNVIKAHKVSRI